MELQKFDTTLLRQKKKKKGETNWVFGDRG